MVRILQKGRKGHEEGEVFGTQIGYGSKRFDVRVKPIRANPRFVPEATQVIKKRKSNTQNILKTGE